MFAWKCRRVPRSCSWLARRGLSRRGELDDGEGGLEPKSVARDIEDQGARDRKLGIDLSSRMGLGRGAVAGTFGW